MTLTMPVHETSGLTGNQRGALWMLLYALMIVLAARMAHWLYWRAASIYGGSNEIQRNILAKAVLSL